MKQELLSNVRHSSSPRPPKAAFSAVPPELVIALDTSSSSESDSEENESAVSGRVLKKRRLSEMGVIMPVLDPQPSEQDLPRTLTAAPAAGKGMVSVNYCKQFWKAGEFEAVPCGDTESSAGSFLLLLLSLFLSVMIVMLHCVVCLCFRNLY